MRLPLPRRQPAGPRATCWPTARQELLLQATLLKDQGANDAWQTWRAGGGDLDNVDPESFRLLAPLYANLVARGVQDPLMGRLKGLHRSLWLRNQLRLRALTAPLRVLRDAGMEVLLLKGCALLLGTYAHFGLRSFADADVLVRPERAWDALAVLGKLGWRPTFYNGRSAMTAGYLETEHAVGLGNDAGESIDLHWHVMPESCRPGADDAFWEHAIPVEHNGLGLRVLDATDQLLHAVAHGLRFEGAPKLRWATDAMAILGKPGAAVDWDRLVLRARELRLGPILAAGLTYLRRLVAAPVPDEPLRHLAATPPSLVDRYELRLRTEEHDLTFLNVLARMWFWHRRLSPPIGLPQLLLGFPRFVQRYYELPRLRDVPLQGLTRGLARMRRDLRAATEGR